MEIYDLLFPIDLDTIAAEGTELEFLYRFAISIAGLILMSIILVVILTYYRNSGDYKKFIRPVVGIPLTLYIVQLGNTLDTFARYSSGGRRALFISSNIINVLPFGVLFYIYGSILKVYIQVPSHRYSRIRNSIIVTRVSAFSILTLAVLFALNLSETLSTIFIGLGSLITLLVMIYLLYIFRILHVEGKDNSSKLIRIRIYFLKTFALITSIYFLMVLPVGPTGGNLDWLYTLGTIYTSVGSFMMYLTVRIPNWVKKRFGLVVPKILDL